jgi:hypothetical protein
VDQIAHCGCGDCSPRHTSHVPSTSGCGRADPAVPYARVSARIRRWERSEWSTAWREQRRLPSDLLLRRGLMTALHGALSSSAVRCRLDLQWSA